MSGLRRGASARQAQNGASSHSPSPAEGRDRVVLAPDPVGRPVAGEGRVVGRLEPRQVGQEVRGEPEERLRLADQAERDLDVPRPPLGLDLAAGQGEPEADPVGLADPPQHPGPEVVEHRVGHQAAEGRAGPVGERGEEGLVLDRLVLVRDLAGPDVEGDRQGPETVRLRGAGRGSSAPWGCRCRRSGSGRRPPSALGQARDREVLDPDAGVEQLGLVARDDQPGGLRRGRRASRARYAS